MALVLITLFATLAFRPSAQAYEYNSISIGSGSIKNIKVMFADGRPDMEFAKSSNTDSNLNRIANILGDEGWELVGIDTYGYGPVLYFKRPKQ